MSKENKREDKNSVNMNKFWTYASIIYILVAALNASTIATNADSNNGLFGLDKTISIYAFLIGACTIIIQLVIFSDYIKDKSKSSHKVIQELKDYIDRKQNVLLPNDSCNSLPDEIWHLIENGKVSYITIICYGTSGFGGIINKLHENSHEIQTNILVCSPYSRHILRDSDRGLIRDLINNRKSNNIIFTESPIPSTIRACVLYDNKNKPIWSSIQTYYYNHKADTHSFDYQKSITIVAKKDSSNILLAGIVEIIEKEFKRLRNFDLKFLGLTNEQIDKLTENQRKVVQYLAQNEHITKYDYKTTYRVYESKATNDLQQLVDYSILKQEHGNFVLVKKDDINTLYDYTK